MDMTMDMGTSLFQDENMGLARAYWYLIVGVLGLLAAIRAVGYIQRRTRSVVFATIHLSPYTR